MKQRLLIAGMVAAVALGCTTTVTTYPDGRIVETEQLDPALVSAAVALGQAALARDSGDPETQTEVGTPVAEDIQRLAEIAAEVEAISADGITGDEAARLVALYEETRVILRRNGVKLKVE